VCLSEGIWKEMGHEHCVWIELGLGRRGGDRWWRGREMKALLSDLRFIRRSLVEGH
jgi:hypothetical protein